MAKPDVTEIKYTGYTLENINTVFGLLYDLQRANEYLRGYKPSDTLYDVIEFNSDISKYRLEIYYSNMPGALCVTGAKGYL